MHLSAYFSNHRKVYRLNLLAALVSVSICFLVLPTTLNAQTSITLLNHSHPVISPNLLVGDTFQILVNGPPNQNVAVSQFSNGSETPDTDAPYVVGSTDSNGNFSLSGAEGATNVGSYIQNWYVGGQPLPPVLTFVVSSGPVVNERHYRESIYLRVHRFCR